MIFVTAHNPRMDATGPRPQRPPRGSMTKTEQGAGAVPDGADDPRPVSIYDVAAAAGVYYQTVSRVITAHPNVKHSPRQLVLAAIARLGFRPNRAARALAGGPVLSVTVLTSN